MHLVFPQQRQLKGICPALHPWQLLSHRHQAFTLALLQLSVAAHSRWQYICLPVTDCCHCCRWA